MIAFITPCVVRHGICRYPCPNVCTLSSILSICLSVWCVSRMWTLSLKNSFMWKSSSTMLPKFTNPFPIDDAMSELTTLHILTTDLFFSMIIRFLPYKHIGTYMYVPRRWEDFLKPTPKCLFYNILTLNFLNENIAF